MDIKKRFDIKYNGKTLLQRFEEKIDKNGPLILATPCWTWMGGTNGKSGYGRCSIRTDGVNDLMLTHRLSYELYVGAIPEGEGYHGTCVLHLCDNRKCVNPEHLFLGSNKENMADKKAKGRQARGETSGVSKLTSKEVLEIRAKYIPNVYSLSMLGKEYSITPNYVWMIIKKKSWVHI